MIIFFWGINQIADELGVDPGTIYKRIQRKQWDCLPKGMFKTSPRKKAEWRCPKDNVRAFRDRMMIGGAS